MPINPDQSYHELDTKVTLTEHILHFIPKSSNVAAVVISWQLGLGLFRRQAVSFSILTNLRPDPSFLIYATEPLTHNVFSL